MTNTRLTVQLLQKRIGHLLSDKYTWVDLPDGWQVEFIVFPDESVQIDYLHPVSGKFWSDENEPLQLPLFLNDKEISVIDLEVLGIPYMTTFGMAKVSETPKEPHLSIIK